MPNHTENFAKLTELLNEVVDLKMSSAVLSWDQNTYMPPMGATGRGRQLGTLGKIAHEKFTSPELGSLLNALEGYEDKLPYESDEASLLRLVRREYQKEIKVSSTFVAELLAHQSATYDVWIKARPKNDFKMVQPYLEKTLELSKKYAQFFNADHIADPLISESDYGFTAENVKAVFTKLRAELVPLVKQVSAHSEKNVSNKCLHQNFPVELQEKFGKKVVAALGYDFSRGRLDKTHHPFMTSFAHGDVRITTRYNENNLSDSLFSTIHEAGHALYELGNAPELDGTYLFGGTSNGVHESQSRLWENIVGRSYGFWQYFYPELQAFFPQQLDKVTLDEFYAAINKVTPSLIRTESDELTYNLHVMIRFDLELAMLEGKLKVKDLPEAWNARYLSDLGVKVPNDTNGCMQDVHWYFSFIGGLFQGYTLGNIMSAQFYDAACQSVPSIPADIQKGNFSTLKAWLYENLHKHGKKFTGTEVLQKATGHELAIEPYVNYLKKKFL